MSDDDVMHCELCDFTEQNDEPIAVGTTVVALKDILIEQANAPNGATISDVTIPRGTRATIMEHMGAIGTEDDRMVMPYYVRFETARGPVLSAAYWCEVGRPEAPGLCFEFPKVVWRHPPSHFIHTSIGPLPIVVVLDRP